jgi:hypothetical protein
MTIKKGATVRQQVPTIEGVVDDRRFDEATEAMEYHVNFTDPVTKEPSARWFKESELKVIKDAPPAPAAKKEGV